MSPLNYNFQIKLAPESIDQLHIKLELWQAISNSHFWNCFWFSACSCTYSNCYFSSFFQLHNLKRFARNVLNNQKLQLFSWFDSSQNLSSLACENPTRINHNKPTWFIVTYLRKHTVISEVSNFAIAKTILCTGSMWKITCIQVKRVTHTYDQISIMNLEGSELNKTWYKKQKKIFQTFKEFFNQWNC